MLVKHCPKQTYEHIEYDHQFFYQAILLYVFFDFAFSIYIRPPKPLN